MKKLLISTIIVLLSTTQAVVIDDFSNGLNDWTIQLNPTGVVSNPGGDPVITMTRTSDAAITVITSDQTGVVGDFDIATSFAGSAVMAGGNSFGLVFGFQNTANYYIAHLFPGFPGSAFRLEKVVEGSIQAVFSGSNTNHDVGFTFSNGDNNSITPDGLRIRKTGNNFQAFVADSSSGGWLSFSGSTWTDSTFGAGLVGISERFDQAGPGGPGTRFATFGEGTAGVDAVLSSTDLSLSASFLEDSTVPEPATYIFALLGFGMVLRVRKK